MSAEFVVKTICSILIFNFFNEMARRIRESKQTVSVKRTCLNSVFVICLDMYIFLIWGFDSVSEFEFLIQGLLATTIAFVGTYTGQLVYISVNKKYWDTILSFLVYALTIILVLAILILPYILGVF